MGIKGGSQDIDREAAKPKFSGEAFPGLLNHLVISLCNTKKHPLTRTGKSGQEFTS